MSALSIAKFLPSLRLKLGTKAVICAILLIALNAALVVGAAYWSLTNEFGERARRDIDISLRTLAMTFAETFPDARITLKDGVVTRAEATKMLEFKDHAIVDRAVSYVGGNATLFVYDDASGQFVRRSTNVKKENGDRAVGTQLAPDHPGQAVLRRGEAYKGPAVLFSFAAGALIALTVMWALAEMAVEHPAPGIARRCPALDEEPSMTTLERLQAILVRDYRLAPETLVAEAPLESLGIDSLGVAELLFNVEDEFGIALPAEPVQLPTLADVVRYIDELVAAQRPQVQAGDEGAPIEAAEPPAS